MSPQIPTNKPDAAAEKWDEMEDELRVAALSGLVDDDLGFGPGVCVVVYFVVVPFSGAKVDGMASHVLL
jgi:hypothetical protein